jgi:hypothetical protein
MLTKPSHYVALGAVVAACIGGYLYWMRDPSATVIGAYNPLIDPNDFVAQVDNKYFTLKPGTKFTYEDRLGTQRVEVVVTDETKKVMGVTTTVVRYTEWRNRRLKETATDWYAQDKHGNVWYFGEAVNNYDTEGRVVDHKGSWEAGVNGGKPGIIMRADPQARMTYRQEYLPGRAEDVGTVIATGRTVTVPFGTFEDCVQIKDWSIILSATEYKYYCPEVGFLVLEEVVGRGPAAELVSISRP